MTTATTATTAALWRAADLSTLRFEEPGADGFHRSWVQLLPEGRFEHPQFGALDFTRPVLDEIKRNFDEHARLMDIALDYDHKASQGDSKAPGWIECVEYRPAQGDTTCAGLWGRVRWTRLGLSDVKDQLYRYISAEVRPDYENPITGKRYKIALIGATLTNRPFMQQMAPVTLAEKNVSTRAWGSVDKSKLPDSAFLDSKNRRLPIYEGAGEIGPDGRYTKRGKLNIHGAEDALAAIHGARSGKAMSGLPAGTEARLRRLLAQHGKGPDAASDDSDAEATTMSEGGQRGTRGNMAGKTSSKKNVAEDDLELDAADGDGEAEEYMDTEDDGAESRDDFDGDADDAPPAKTPKKAVATKAAKGSAKMSEASDEEDDADGAESGALTFAEAQQMRDQIRALEYKLYEAEVTKQVDGYAHGTFTLTFSETRSATKNPAHGVKTEREAVVAVSKAARDAYLDLMLHEGFTMSEATRAKITTLFETAIRRGVVDLSTRAKSFDQEAPRGGKSSGGANGGNDINETALSLALSEGKLAAGAGMAEFMKLDLREREQFLLRAGRELGV